MTKKKTPIDDGVKNAQEAQHLDAKTRMPRGVKKPKQSPK